MKTYVRVTVDIEIDLPAKVSEEEAYATIRDQNLLTLAGVTSIIDTGTGESMVFRNLSSPCARCKTTWVRSVHGAYSAWCHAECAACRRRKDHYEYYG